MRVLILSSFYGVQGGGSGVIARHLATGLSDVGHDVSVITIGGTHHYSISQEQGIKVYRFMPVNLYPFKEKDTHPAWQRMIWQFIDIYNAQAAHTLRQILMEESPDIVHLNKMRGFSGAVWSVASQLYPARVIQTCHDYESMSPDGLLRGWIGRMALTKRWPVRGYQIIRAHLSSRVNAVTAPSRFTLDRIVESGLFASAQARVIPNTHGWRDDELDTIHSRGCNSSDGNVRFLYIGRLEAEKGIKELCDIFVQLYASYPSIRLDIAGQGTLNKELRTRFDTHPGIRFLGVVSGKAKDDALCNTTVVVAPSLVEEVFGLVTIEAFAFGKPVIASNLGGLPELVRPGETGWLFSATDFNTLHQQMALVVRTNSLELERMSTLCWEYSYRFSMNKVIQEYEGLYNQLIDGVAQ